MCDHARPPGSFALERASQEDREALVDRFFAGTGQSYDRVVALTTVGLDKYWKRRLLERVPADATSILDLACGTGIVTQKLHERAPNARIVGVDLTEEYLEVARAKFADTDADITFVHANAETMEVPGTFDVVVSSYLPKYVKPEILLDRIEGLLEPGGLVALHDFDRPRGRIPRYIWRGHMWFLRVVGSRVWPAWTEAFDRDLETLICTSHWAKTYYESLLRRGYEDVRREPISFGTAAVVSGLFPG